MLVPFHDTDAGPVPSQFKGYAQLDELDWAGYGVAYTNIQRLDRILKADGDDPDRYQVAKQADTATLFVGCDSFPEHYPASSGTCPGHTAVDETAM